jgi:UDP-N-acetylmuramate dehydrogenase
MNITIETNKCLQDYNSLALPALAAYFCRVSDYGQMQNALAFAQSKSLAVIPLGAGSNMVLASDIEGLVIYIDLKGVDVQKPTDRSKRYVDITFQAGENWHEMVSYSLAQGWYGLENLSLIPGNMGAAAIQNIGAYGAELSDILVSLNIVDIESGKLLSLSAEECQFSYRNSIFKQSLKDKCIITDITLRLSTHPVINLEYPALKHYFHDPLLAPTAQMVSEAVSKIRRSKLPNPKALPNVGSFFKNPVISTSLFTEIESKFENSNVKVPGYPQSNGAIKVPAGWLVEQCQFKGVRRGSAGVHEHQALVLVNYSDPKTQDQDSARDILELAADIQKVVLAEFSVDLEIEPRIYGSI